MTQATTTLNGFTSVAQSGSGVTWTGLSNMVYPTEGTGACELTAVSRTANTVLLRIPEEAADIPTGSTLESMALYITVKKTGTFSAGTNITWTGETNSSLSTVWSYLNNIDETYANLSISGDSTYWKLSSTYDPSAMIDGLKDGTLYFKVNATSTAAVACGIRINEAVCTITYNTVEGKRGAIIAALI